jgi:hypothetical protein
MKQITDFPKLPAKECCILDSESLGNQQQLYEASSKEKQEDKLRKGIQSGENNEK